MRRSVVRSVETDHRTNMESPKLPSRSKPLYFALFPRFFLSNPKHAKKNLWIFVAAAAATIPLFLFLFFAATNSRSRVEKRFGIVIDGGSTGTRIHVFEFLNASGNVVLDLKNGGLASMKVNPGLSSFSDDPESAGMSLSELLEFGKGRIPKAYWGETDIRLMATAGLRRLDVEVQERILEACRRVLRSSGFRFKDEWASVISGADEGIYAWAAANYALGTLGGDPQETTGIIELGGASAQVTFASSESLPSEFSHTIKFGEFTYNLYSHSLLDFGLNVAYDSLHESLLSRDLKLSGRSIGERISVDPCTPRGFSLGAKSVKFPAKDQLFSSVLGAKDQLFSSIRARGNFSECRSAALMLLQKGKDECTHQQCLIGSTFIPELQGKFLATENFFYTSKFFGLPTTAFLSDLILAGQKFCGEDWRMLKKKYSTLHEEDLVTYCFSSAYIVALLHDSLGISLNDERIGFANQAGGIPLDWALGAFILLKTGEIENEHREGAIASIIGDDSSALLSLFIISSLLVFAVWSISKWRKPQLKTIYDLENGRYIIARVNR